MGTTALERFVRFLEQSERSPITIRGYVADVRDFSRWLEKANGDALDPARITSTDLRQYKRLLVEERRLKPASTNRKLATLKSFLRWAAEAGLMPEGPPPKVPKPETHQRQGPRWLDRREQNALLRAVERDHNARDIAIVKLLLNTGLRVQELCALTWQDVRLSERKGTLTVRKGKGGKHREVPVNKDARSALLSMGYSKLAGKHLPVFVGQRGRLTSRGVQMVFSGYVVASGVDRVSPHVLRHSFCKNLVDAGVGLEQVAALAGHESLETTRRYCEPSHKDLERAVELIAEEE
jgi:integrase/recombinase XerC